MELPMIFTTCLIGCIVSIRAKPFSTNINTNTNYNFNIDDVTAFIEIFNTLFSGQQLTGTSGMSAGIPSAGSANSIPHLDALVPPSLDELAKQVKHSSANNININTNTNLNENILSVLLTVLNQILNSNVQPKTGALDLSRLSDLIAPAASVAIPPTLSGQQDDLPVAEGGGSLNINSNNNFNSNLGIASIFEQVLNSNFLSDLANHRRLSARRPPSNEEDFLLAGFPHHPQDTEAVQAAKKEFFKTFSEIKFRAEQGEKRVQ